MEITSQSFGSVRWNTIYILISVATICVYTGFICSEIIEWQIIWEKNIWILLITECPTFNFN
jgi:hypothetical protein